MFSKIENTAFPPANKPMLVWDGECGFCKYWILYLKNKTGNNLDFETFQKVSENFSDIPLKEFKKASRLIEMDGFVFSGPDSLYRSLEYFEKPQPHWHRWYKNYKWFRFGSDHAYNFIAKHRSLMFSITKVFFGKNPQALKPYWFLLLLFLFSILYMLWRFL